MLFISANLQADPEIVVDISNARLAVLEHGKLLLQLEQIAIGRFGASKSKQKGDGMTPIGKYQVGWIKQDSQFNQFIGINYPGAADAERGASEGIIDQQTYDRIMTAHDQHKIPPQNTELGGFLGIHGLGNADAVVHKRYNWTKGCIATTNEQLEKLLPWVKIGTWVEIR